MSHHGSLEIVQGIANRLSEANARNNIGLDREMRGRQAEALEHRQQAQDVFRDTGAASEQQIDEENAERDQARIEASR